MMLSWPLFPQPFPFSRTPPLEGTRAIPWHGNRGAPCSQTGAPLRPSITRLPRAPKYFEFRT
jgi:hypothetical protein